MWPQDGQRDSTQDGPMRHSEVESPQASQAKISDTRALWSFRGGATMRYR
jgi:hypothetical protein